jgi:hypothetical protein
VSLKNLTTYDSVADVIKEEPKYVLSAVGEISNTTISEIEIIGPLDCVLPLLLITSTLQSIGVLMSV